MRKPSLACLLLILATFSVYLQVCQHDFINYDDPKYVTENSRVKAGLKAESVLWAFTSFHASNWHPVTWLSHMLDIQLFGMESKWHHLMNVLLHLGNTMLLFILLDGMTASPWRSLFVAALFALHPLHVESVAWVSERKDVLSTLFFLLTLLFYHRYVKFQSLLRYLAALGTFCLGLMSKPMLVTLPFVLLLLDYWPLGRMEISRPDSRIWKRLLLEKMPFFVLSVASSIITVFAQSEAMAPLESVPFVFRCVNAVMAYVYYIGKMLWPLNLAPIYPLHATWTIQQGIAAFLLLAGITVISLSMSIRRPYCLTGWLWYLGTLVPVIGLVQVGMQFIADRYTYIPLIGIYIMMAWGIPEWIRDNRHKGIVLTSLAAIILLFFSVVTFLQLHHWRDSVNLFRHVTERFPENHIARNKFGNALSNAGRMEEAVSQFSRVLQGRPKDVEALTGIGFVLAKQGKDEEAARYFTEALRIDPASAESHFHIGLLMAEKGRLEDGIYHFKKVLEVRPDDVEAHYNMGVALVKQGKPEEAVFHFKEVLRIKPDLKQAAVSLEAAYRLQIQSDGWNTSRAIR